MSDQGLKSLENLVISKIKRRIEEIRGFMFSDPVDVSDVAMAETLEHLSPAAARRLPYRPVRDGQSWGQPWGTAWFRLRFAIPRAFDGQAVSLEFRTDGECIIFRNGVPVQALDHGRDRYPVAAPARGGERVELYVEAGANAAFGGFTVRTMRQPKLAVAHREVCAAYYDLAALADMIDPEERKVGASLPYTASTLEENDTRRARIIFTLNKAVDGFDYNDPSTADRNAQARRVRRLLQPLYACRAHDSAQTIAAMGHAHIDVAWLWPLAETVRKCGRTFSNVLALMDRYPEFVFVQSQPHLYEFTRDRYPALYRRIREKIKKGQWIPTGCMWVEADCNVTSGESLVRQVLFGTRFFKREFGHEVACLWLPDVFGYSAALPQILRRSGIRYFLTQKISWNQFTVFPHHSFYWKGIDGSPVLSHFVPAADYNSRLQAYQMLTAARRYRQKDRSPIQAVPFGFGNGGGGPTEDMIERMLRYRDLEGMPKLRPMSPKEFFTRLEKESVELPSWTGELYLELHRATYTTQAYNKKFNRQAELLLRDAELLSVWGLERGDRYDQALLNATWKQVLLHQFHDIIPGSSIDEVYRDSDRAYARILSDAGAVKDQCMASLARRADTRGEGAPVLAVNSLSWDRDDLVAVDGRGFRAGAAYVAVSSDGGEVPVQLGADRQARFIGRLPSMGYATFHIRKGRTAAPDIRASARLLENEHLRVRFDRLGRVAGILDKQARREVLEPGAPGNRFTLFEDKPHAWDAWDLDLYYNDKPVEVDGRLLSADVAEQGPVRSVVRFIRTIGCSRITQDVVLAAGSRRLDFATEVAWGNEKDVLLKVAFPVNIRAEKARYEIQFGNVERPTHWNTPKDFAMFEVPAQKWADLAEGDYGVALMNDCKYGHDIRDNVMRLTLLRAPKSPGKTADVNKVHRFTYALFPHPGDYSRGVVRRASELNGPVAACRPAVAAGREPACRSYFSIDGENVLIDTVKKAEDDAGVIVRLYEAHGSRGLRTFRTTLPVKRAVETDLMEKEEKAFKVVKGCIQLDFAPFQIRTLKLTPSFIRRGRRP